VDAPVTSTGATGSRGDEDEKHIASHHLEGEKPMESRRRCNERAVRRYERRLRGAPPGTLEQVHDVAFSKLTDEQRDLMFDQLLARAAADESPPPRRTSRWMCHHLVAGSAIYGLAPGLIIPMEWGVVPPVGPADGPPRAYPDDD
jgi:hypothetical protein